MFESFRFEGPTWPHWDRCLPKKYKVCTRFWSEMLWVELCLAKIQVKPHFSQNLDLFGKTVFAVVVPYSSYWSKVNPTFNITCSYTKRGDLNKKIDIEKMLQIGKRWPRMSQERGQERVLFSQTSEGTNPGDILISNV